MVMSHVPEIKTGDDLRKMSLAELKLQLDLRMKKIEEAKVDLSSAYPHWGISIEAKILAALIRNKDSINNNIKNQILCSLDALDEWKIEENKKQIKAELDLVYQKEEQEQKAKMAARQEAIKKFHEELAKTQKERYEKFNMNPPEQKKEGNVHAVVQYTEIEYQTEKREKTRIEAIQGMNYSNTLKSQRKKAIHIEESKVLIKEKELFIKKYHLAFDKYGMIYSTDKNMSDEEVQICIKHIMLLDKLAIELSTNNQIEAYHLDPLLNRLLAVMALKNIGEEVNVIQVIAKNLGVQVLGDLPSNFLFYADSKDNENKKLVSSDQLEQQYRVCLQTTSSIYDQEKLKKMKSKLTEDWNNTPKSDTKKLQKLINEFNEIILINESNESITFNKEKSKVVNILRQEMGDLVRRHELYYSIDYTNNNNGVIKVEKRNGNSLNVSDQIIQERLNKIYSLVQEIESGEVKGAILISKLNTLKSEMKTTATHFFSSYSNVTGKAAIDKAIKLLTADSANNAVVSKSTSKRRGR